MLAPSGYYLPGYRAGGPIQTLAGLAEALEGEFDFKILTRDRDLGDADRYHTVTVDSWTEVGPAQVMYLSPRSLSILALRRLISTTLYDLLYLNSLFSVPFAILPLLLRRLRLVPNRPAIIAPRGELAPGALAFKPRRKHFYIFLSRRLGLLGNVVWQASGPHEATDIRRLFGEGASVAIASDMAVIRPSLSVPRIDKTADQVRLLFISRISRMKNLDGALRILQNVAGAVQFSIYGPVEDAKYWSGCRELITHLPSNVVVNYGGPLRPDAIATVMAQHDLFFLPTLGEAFGHVILEAMVGGCPVLISDRTRWRRLEAAGVGWDVALDQPDRFRQLIEHCVSISADAWREMSERTRAYGLRALNSDEARDRNRELFRSVYSNHPAARLDRRSGGTAR